MKQNEQLNVIMSLVLKQQLGAALRQMENYLLAFPRQSDADKLSSLRDDYRLLAGYWQQGFEDPQRTDVALRLLQRTYTLTANVMSAAMLSDCPFLMALHQRSRKARNDWSVGTIRQTMEDFVANVAIAQMEQGRAGREETLLKLHQEHEAFMRYLFEYILTSKTWRDTLADAFIDMLLSPTLYSIDQQLIVSAVTLSALQQFCPQKFRVLLEVYRTVSDEAVRQRALAGWYLVACCADEACSEVCPKGYSVWQLFPGLQTSVQQMLDDEHARQEIAQLQMQLFFCLDADADRDTIQKEILPDIISGSKLKVTRHGLVEMDDDNLDDILHPEAEEQNMERMEQSMRRMADMQRQGADIYFGGFSQMKRFPFFNDVSNWLVPFYGQHPGISRNWNKPRGQKFLKTITRMGGFCDSDRYSLVLAFDMVLDRLPQQMLEMIEKNEATATPMGGEVSPDEAAQPAFIRRMYLQDLYRFFRLHPSRASFRNPFDASRVRRLLFFAHPLAAVSSMAQQTVAVARFLLKRHRYKEATQVLRNMPAEAHDVSYHILMGTTLMHSAVETGDYAEAQKAFSQALQLQPDNERALAGLARNHYATGSYEQALLCYSRLADSHPDNRQYLLNEAVCMLNVGQHDEALQLLYKLSYLHADDPAVSRIMAWALTLNGKYEQAEKTYRLLTTGENTNADDLLNYGYCLWLMRKVGSAITLFRRFMQTQSVADFSFEEELMSHEYDMLTAKGITDTEIRLMIDAVTE